MTLVWVEAGELIYFLLFHIHFIYHIYQDQFLAKSKIWMFPTISETINDRFRGIY